MNTLKEWALYYASIGLPVFPLIPREKTPAISGAFHKATRDPATINEWWTNTKTSNIGIATGDGLVCIDLDCKHDGEDGAETLRAWEEESGKFPDCWTAITPTGSIHYYFSYDPFREIIGTINHELPFPDIDIHGDGSYMVAPPSVILVNGIESEYLWEVSGSPEEMALTEADDVVLGFIHEAFSFQEAKDQERFSFPEVIEQGTRNRTLFRAAASMQAKGFSDRAIYSAIEIENEDRCNPSLKDKEVKGIIDSVLKRYPKGGSQAWTRKQVDLLNQEAKLLRAKKNLIQSKK